MTLTSIENIENLHLGENRSRRSSQKQTASSKPKEETVSKPEKDISTEVEPLLKVLSTNKVQTADMKGGLGGKVHDVLEDFPSCASSLCQGESSVT